MIQHWSSRSIKFSSTCKNIDCIHHHVDECGKKIVINALDCFANANVPELCESDGKNDDSKVPKADVLDENLNGAYFRWQGPKNSTKGIDATSKAKENQMLKLQKWWFCNNNLVSCYMNQVLSKSKIT